MTNENEGMREKIIKAIKDNVDSQRYDGAGIKIVGVSQATDQILSLFKDWVKENMDKLNIKCLGCKYDGWQDRSDIVGGLGCIGCSRRYKDRYISSSEPISEMKYILAWVKENVVVGEFELYKILDNYILKDKENLRKDPRGYYLSEVDTALLLKAISKGNVIKIKE